MLDKNTQNKISFSGVILSVQPRSNVWRYRLDNRTHSMTGYNIFLKGTAEGEEKDFAVAISEKQQQKFRYESFCYGPKSCKLYKMGKPRAVPYKDCGTSYDEGWLDDICTERRGEDE